jgi:hypothetical protein
MIGASPCDANLNRAPLADKARLERGLWALVGKAPRPDWRRALTHRGPRPRDQPPPVHPCGAGPGPAGQAVSDKELIG